MHSSSSAIAILVGGTVGFSAAACSRTPAEATRPDAAPTASAASSPSANAAPSATVEPNTAEAKDEFPIPREGIDSVLNPRHLPPYDGPTGSVEGTVLVTGPAAPTVHVDASKCPAAIDTYGKLFREGPRRPDGSRPLADAVVVVVGYTGYYLPEREPAVRIAIEPRCGYSSRTIAMTFGQRLEVRNQTKLLFGPVIDQDHLPAVLMAPPLEKGDPVKLYPRQAAYLTISDQMQPFVHEDLYVFRHPLHAVTDLDGHFRIDGVPVGALKVGVHHPGAGADAQAPVEIVENIVRRVDLTVTYEPKPAKAVDSGRKDFWLN
jgi:hypothetical protein